MKHEKHEEHEKYENQHHCNFLYLSSLPPLLSPAFLSLATSNTSYRAPPLLRHSSTLPRRIPGMLDEQITIAMDKCDVSLENVHFKAAGITEMVRGSIDGWMDGRMDGSRFFGPSAGIHICLLISLLRVC